MIYHKKFRLTSMIIMIIIFIMMNLIDDIICDDLRKKNAPNVQNKQPNNQTIHDKLNEYCNPLIGCNDTNLICVNYECICAYGYDSHKKECNSFENCSNDKYCQVIDKYRKCDQNEKKCINCSHNLYFDEKRQRCVSYLGQACYNNNDLEKSISYRTLFDQRLICRNGIYVCRPDHYPDEQWTHCQAEKMNCQKDDDCQLFSDYNRICQQSRQSPEHKRCVCAPGTHENRHTLQCMFIGSIYTNFLMMPFFLLPICLMIAIIAYIGIRLMRASSTNNTNRISRTNCRRNYCRTRNGRTTSSTSPSTSSTNVIQSQQPTNRLKTPSVLNRLDLNDLPPSYESVLNQQERQQQQSNDLRHQSSTQISMITSPKTLLSSSTSASTSNA